MTTPEAVAALLANEADLKNQIASLRAEVRKAWSEARGAKGQLEAFRILEQMVDHVGYQREKFVDLASRL